MQRRMKSDLNILKISVYILSAFYIHHASCQIKNRSGVKELRVGQTLSSQTILIDEQIIRYRPLGLLPNRSYEVRISFPATNPVYIHLWLEPSNKKLDHLFKLWRYSNRKLLNAEKIMFVTNNEGNIIFERDSAAKNVDVAFKATHWALSKYGKKGGQKVLLYDIVLEQNVLGIPFSGLPVVFAAIVLVLGCAAIVPWWTGNAVPWMHRWLATGELKEKH